MFTKQVSDSPLYKWFDERLDLTEISDDIASKYVPPHVNIFYCLGGITLTCFLIQFATGFAMTFYYRPTVAEAFNSVSYLMTQVNFGWLIRSIHRWSASMMVLMMILHVFRVYLTGGFKKTPGIDLGDGGGAGGADRILRCDGLFPPLGPGGLLGGENRHRGAGSGAGGRFPGRRTVAGGCGRWARHLDPVLQCPYLCVALVDGGVYADALPDDPQTRDFGPPLG